MNITPSHRSMLATSSLTNIRTYKAETEANAKNGGMSFVKITQIDLLACLLACLFFAKIHSFCLELLVKSMKFYAILIEFSAYLARARTSHTPKNTL